MACPPPPRAFEQAEGVGGAAVPTREGVAGGAVCLFICAAGVVCVRLCGVGPPFFTFCARGAPAPARPWRAL